MTSSPATNGASDQLDRDVSELRPEHRQVLMLDPSRRHPQRVHNRASEAANQAYVGRQLRAAIATQFEWGDTLDTIDRQLIASSGLGEDEQSALWLYAWSHPKRRSATAARLSVWAALGNALLTLVGIYRY